VIHAGIFCRFDLMKSSNIDILNIGLILGSLIFAILLPFKLFLWSYAFLGPIHYVTEINWLHQKKYFVQIKKTVWLLVILTVFIIGPMLIYANTFIPLQFYNNHPWFHKGLYFFWNNSVIFLLIAVFISIVLTYLKKIKYLWLYILIGLGLVVTLAKFNLLASIGVLLPSIVHVYIFTMLFMLYGTLKTNGVWGFIAVIILMLVPFVICVLPIKNVDYLFNSEAYSKFNETGFNQINQVIVDVIGLRGEYTGLSIDTKIRVQIFIAFAYTYHYLNWFSKTTKIGWHKALFVKNGGLDKIKIIMLLLFWIIASVIYLYDYIFGVYFFLLISYLHVVLEFPLNYISIKEIILFFKQKLFYK
jgi:hypothetical protein